MSRSKPTKSADREPSLKEALADVAREMKNQPEWLKTIYRRNRETEEWLRAQRERNDQR